MSSNVFHENTTNSSESCAIRWFRVRIHWFVCSNFVVEQLILRFGLELKMVSESALYMSACCGRRWKTLPQDEASANIIYRFVVETVGQHTNNSSCDFNTSALSRFRSIRLNSSPNVFQSLFHNTARVLFVVRHECLCFQNPEVGRIVALEHRSCHLTPEP